MKAQMGFDLSLQRAAALAATSRGEHRVVDGRSGDAKMARQLNRVEAGVMNGFELRAQLERPPQRLRIEIRHRVNDDDAYLIAFAESQLDKRNAFIFTIPPIDRFDVERDHGRGVEAFERGRDREFVADEFDGVVEHRGYLL
jgi:hypothetical protein